MCGLGTQREGTRRIITMDHTNETKLRVRYAETDKMGVVYYGNFFTWFEIGRVEFLRALGLNYRDLEETEGFFIMVVDAHCRYQSPARYDEELAIRTQLKSLRGPVVRFEYEIWRVADRVMLATGDTTHLVTNRQTKVCALPAKYFAVLEGALTK
jgi:acyl-CoA thioester hydrolase